MRCRPSDVDETGAEVSIDFTLRETREPVLHGDQGLSQKGPEAGQRELLLQPGRAGDDGPGHDGRAHAWMWRHELDGPRVRYERPERGCGGLGLVQRAVGQWSSADGGASAHSGRGTLAGV